MSDAPLGDGWWIASDGKWYPPETHPDYRPPPPPPPGAPMPPGAPGAYTPYPNPSLPPPMIATQPAAVGAYASFGARAGARIIDGMITGIPFSIVFAIAANAVPTTLEPCTVNGRLGICEQPTDAGAAILVGIFGAWLLFLIFFWWGYLEGRTGQTPGRKVANIKIVDAQTGKPIGMGAGIGRGLFSFISWFALGLGILWVLWDRKRQTWHDKVTGSVVVRT